jgi:ABC-2 type transport system permease protein
MIGFSVLLRKEVLEQVRTWRMVVVVIVFAIFGIGSAALARYTPELVKALAGSQFTIQVPKPTVADAVAQFLKNLGQTGILAAVLLSMGSVATEKERGTAALLLTKPASRGAFLSAKLVAIAITLGVGILAAGIAGYVYTALLFSAPSVAGYAAMCGLLLLSLVGYASLTFLGSTLVRSALPAAAIGVGAMAVLAIVSALPTIGPNAPGNLNGPAAALALGKAADPLLGPVLATIGLIVVAFVIAWLAFRRQEL